MAERIVTLTMTPREERALASLIADLCAEYREITGSRLREVFTGDPDQDAKIEKIGRINAALNGNN